MHWLQGKKTYVCAIAVGCATVAHALGWLPDEAYQALLGMLGAGTVVALRAGVKKDTGAIPPKE